MDKLFPLADNVRSGWWLSHGQGLRQEIWLQQTGALHGEFLLLQPPLEKAFPSLSVTTTV